MKTKKKSVKKTSARLSDGFDAVKFMREQRERITKEIMNLSPEEIVKYFKQHQPKERVKPNA